MKAYALLRQMLTGRLSPRGLIAVGCLIAGGAGTLALDRSIRTNAERLPPRSTVNRTHLMKSMMAHARHSKGAVPSSMITGLAHRLKAGSPAPDFTLPAIMDQGEVSLSSFLGKPVILVFGSFSCDTFCERISEIERLHRAYEGRAVFLFVSVTEAGHPIPGLEFVIDPAGPDTPEERRARVGKAMRQMGMTLFGALDVGAAAETAYDAYPNRLVIVDAEGKIARDIGRSLFRDRWDLDEIEVWLKEQAGCSAQ